MMVLVSGVVWLFKVLLLSMVKVGRELVLLMAKLGVTSLVRAVTSFKSTAVVIQLMIAESSAMFVSLKVV